MPFLEVVLVGMGVDTDSVDLEEYDGVTLTINGTNPPGLVHQKWGDVEGAWPIRLSSSIKSTSPHIYRLPKRGRFFCAATEVIDG